MNCCNPGKSLSGKEEQNKQYKCPLTKDEGVNVKLVTVKSLVKVPLQANVRLEEKYKFCINPECPIVYFSKDPTHYFQIKDLKEKVTQKDKGLDVKLCYCFGHTRESILKELKISGESTVLQDIKEKMKDPGCFCEVSNPHGSCCLGNVSSWVREAKLKIE